jgi:NAD(P)-dependent dehydrogenase (short-subunit alcohol dehydrogenase family)
VELAGRTALVTGGAAGTGRAIARRLAEHGAHVVVTDIDPRGEALARELGGRFVRADITDPDPELFAGVDVLVNNAGGGHVPPLYPEAPPEVWSAKLDLNLRAPMLATQLALRAGATAIVNIASSAGAEDTPHALPEYAAAKAGLIRFTTALKTPPGVRINCIVVGWIRTERAVEELRAMTASERAAAPPTIAMEDVADAVVRLVEDDALNHHVLVLSAT